MVDPLCYLDNKEKKKCGTDGLKEDKNIIKVAYTVIQCIAIRLQRTRKLLTIVIIWNVFGSI